MIKKPAILVVEDDENLRLPLVDNLEEEGFAVLAVATGGQALRAAGEGAFGLILLDIMLPDSDGYTICRKLREGGFTGMIMMLTVRSLEEDLVKGFESGADDYLCKPYRLRELLSRTRALLRRGDGAFAPGSPTPQVARFAGYKIDIASRSVTSPEGDAIELTRTEFDMLLLMVKFQGQALTRDRILDQVWGEEVVVDARTVDNFVSSLKRKLGWKPSSGFKISSIRGVGYRFETLGD